MLDIFVAEDNPGDVVLLREMLNEYSVAHRLHVENDGEAAIQFITGYDGQAPGPDVFVIDMRMPKADGLTIAKSIRDRSCFSTLPILLMSSVLSETEQRDIQTIPSCLFFEKPVLLDDWAEISYVIQTLCDKPSRSRPGRAREIGGTQRLADSGKGRRIGVVG